jgi:flagellar basal body-associated protein FliL
MKKRTILTILITGIIMLAAAVGGYFLYTAKNRPPEVPLYLSMDEIQRDVETFEATLSSASSKMRLKPGRRPYR